MKCLGCDHAEWYRTKSGQLHPCGEGECRYQYKVPELPASLWWIDGQPKPNGGRIFRKEELERNCPYHTKHLHDSKCPECGNKGSTPDMDGNIITCSTCCEGGKQNGGKTECPSCGRRQDSKPEMPLMEGSNVEKEKSVEELIELFRTEMDALDNIRRDLAAQECKLRELMKHIYKTKFGVEAGIVVYDSKGVRYKVMEVDTVYLDLEIKCKPWLKAFREKKDGTWSTKTCYVYSEWEVEAVGSSKNTK